MKDKLGISFAFLALIIGAITLVACGGGNTSKNAQGTTLPTATTALGQTLRSNTALLPVEAGYSQPNTAKLATENIGPTPTTTTADTPLPAIPTPSVIQHTVQPGDTLLGLAMDYGVSMAAIQLTNGMGNSIDLVAGQTLSIPGGDQWLNESYYWVVHVVQSGETLVGLSNAYELTVDEILRVNAIADPAMIHIDQQLVIPLAQLVTLDAPQPATPAIAIAAAAPIASAQDLTPNTAPETETSTPESPATAIPPPSMPAGPADWSTYILARINQVRAEHGLNTLTIAPELTYAAQAHAQDCAQRGWGSHVGSDGAVLKTRLERAGYFGTNWGENWVQALNAERGFDWWYGEIPPNDPHRRNILSPRYTEIGIGIAETGWGYTFITDFGHR